MKRSSKKQYPNAAVTFPRMKEKDDFISYEHRDHPTPYQISYLYSLIDPDILHRDILIHLRDGFSSLEELKRRLPFEDITIAEDAGVIEEKLLAGYVQISLLQEPKSCLLVKCLKVHVRDVSPPEIEFSVEGPKEAFTESLQTNLNLIRKRLPVIGLQLKELTIGTDSKTKVAVMFLEGKANEQDVKLVLSRLRQIQFEQILDSSYIQQMIQDNWKSPFPQIKNTERADRVCGQLMEGKVAILVDGSPLVLCAPISIVSFFSSMEDYYLPWQIGTVIRLIRYFAVTFSVLATPLYVAVLTYHYQLIPKDLLGTLIGSRANIPFPPIIEALFLEITIELLREAGARLPTKVGQTIGIVGGIVIGQASVEASLTSNVLLIFVALAALASFTTPVYRMGTTIRLLRFPFLLFAAWLGLLGVMICAVLLTIHLLRLTSLERPYLEPIYPPRPRQWRDVFVRFPYLRNPLKKSSRDPVMHNLLKDRPKADIDE